MKMMLYPLEAESSGSLCLLKRLTAAFLLGQQGGYSSFKPRTLHNQFFFLLRFITLTVSCLANTASLGASLILPADNVIIC